MANQEDAAKRRGEAQAAMEDETHRRERAERAAQKSKRQEEARRALEGEEWRGRRELREKLQAKKEAEKELLSQSRQAEQETRLEERRAAETAARHQAEQEAVAFDQRLEKIESAKQAIGDLKDKTVSMSPIRTLQSDLTRVIKEEGLSVSTIALSEQARKRFGLGPAAAPTKPKSRLVLLLIVLVVIMVGGGFFLRWFQGRAANYPGLVPAPAPAGAFLFAEADGQINLLPGGAWREPLRNAIKAGGGDWTIKNLVFIQNGNPLSWTRVAEALDFNLTEALKRNLDAQYMFGVYRPSGGTGQPFILLKSTFPDQAFAGLIEWEPRLASDLFPLFYDTPPALKGNLFSDKLIRNKDTRVLIGQNDQVVLLYAFLDRETIILAPSEEVFVQVFDRLLN